MIRLVSMQQVGWSLSGDPYRAYYEDTIDNVIKICE